MKMSYFPIQVLSAYSLLKSTTTPTMLIEHAKSLGYDTVALTDYDNLYGMVDFYNTAKKAGIKPIIGITLTINGLINQSTLMPLILLAKNDNGYHNLIRISSYKMTLPNPNLANLNDIEAYLSDLVIISPVEGEIQQLLVQGQTQLANEAMKIMASLITLQDFYLGINLAQSQLEREALLLFSQTNKLKLVVAERVDYLQANDYFATRVMQAIDANIVLSNLGQIKNELGPNYLKSVTEIEKNYRLAGLKDAYINVQKIAEQIAVELNFKQPQLPSYPLPVDKTNTADYLLELAKVGLELRGLTTPAYEVRLTQELAIINQLGFNDYFLIIWDVIQWAHQQNIQTGPGRGSAAGSLVAYALSITDVDPLKYDLLFERFLNPARAQMPDIDLDLPDNRREEVLNYMHEKYGHTHVAQIITFGTLATKQVIRDVGRVFGYTQPQLARMAKTIPVGKNISISELMINSSALKNLMVEFPNGELLLKVAQRLEGLPRNYSTHAAGVVISKEQLIDVVPVQTGPDQRLMTQLTKNSVESLGLLKMDFLGLRNLTLLATVLDSVKSQEPTFTLDSINLNDTATLALFQQGQTNGIFQFESNGIKRVLRELKPDSFEMITAVNALYRPGPMENINHFIARKHGNEPIDYIDDVLKPILAPTFGIIVYQEQVMRVASVFAGFSLSEADMLRRAISKKDGDKITVLRQKFIIGATGLGHQASVAQKIYDYIEAFADYGFNRSHAIAYSKMAFQLAFFKVHYSREFFMALMNANLGNDSKLMLYTQELRQASVAVIGPDVNRSERDFSITNGALQFGLGSIKGLRSDFINAIIVERYQRGPFKDLANLINRLDNRWRTENYLLPLIKAGACDSFEYNRHELVMALDGILAAVGFSGKSLSLFASMAPKINHLPDYSLVEKLKMEQEILGTYISSHPVNQYRALIQEVGAVPLNQVSEKGSANIIVLLTNARIIRTKKGQEMTFLTVTDATGEQTITVFPTLYQQIKAELKKFKIYLIQVSVERNGKNQLIANKIQMAEKYQTKSNENINKNVTGQWFLRLTKNNQTPQIETKLQQILLAHHGDFQVIIYYEAQNRKILLAKEFWVQKNNATLVSLTSLLGRENVIFKAF